MSWDAQQSRDTDALLLDENPKKVEPPNDLKQSPYHSIDASLCCGLLRGSVRQDWNTLATSNGDLIRDAFTPSWIQLFFDLNIVASLSNITVAAVNSFADLSGSNRYEFLIIAFLQYYLIYLLWTEFIQFESQFILDTKLDIILFLLCSFTLLSMGYASHSNIEYFSYFLFAFGTAKIVYLLVYIKISFIPRAKKWAIFHILFALVTIICAFIISSLSISSAIVWIMIYLIFIFIAHCKQLLSWFYQPISTKIAIPINTHHLRERMEQFAMIVVGGCIVSLITGSVDVTTPSLRWNYYATVYGSYLCICVILIIYFTSQPSKHEEMMSIHALTRSPKHCTLFIFGHALLYLSLFLFGIGVGIINLLMIANDSGIYDADKAIAICLPCLSLSASCISLNMIRVSHFTRYHQLKLVWMIRIVSIVVMVVMPLCWNVVDAMIIVAIDIICVVIQSIADVKGKRREEEQFKKERHEGKQLLQKYIKQGLSSCYGSFPTADEQIKNDYI
eukprot:254029_1